MIRLSFINPLALWLLLLLPLLWGLAWAMRTPNLVRLGRWRYLALLGVRSLLLLALVLALADTQAVRPVEQVAVAFLIDGSDSVAPARRQEAIDYVNQALTTARPGDQAAVVLFGAAPAVERAAGPPLPLGQLSSLVAGSRTNLAEALQLALALLPAEAQKRIVLLSDGAENSGRALEMARLAVLRGIPIESVALLLEPGPDLLVVGLEAPASAREGQRLPLSLQLEAGSAGPARIEIFADGELVASEERQLPAGPTSLSFALPSGEAGFRRFEARVSAPTDQQPLNNRGAAFTLVEGPPRVLLIASEATRTAALASALQAANLRVDQRTPAQVPASPAELRRYAAILLVDLPAAAVPAPLQRALVTYVRDQGGGLAMIGGSESFGAGGWRRTPLAAILPVDLDPPDKQQRPDLALALVIDRSGSMSDSDGPGPSRLDLAREAVFLATRGLAQTDRLGVIVFDDLAQTVLPLQALPDLTTIEEALSMVSPDGGTNIRAGVELGATTLAATDARIKHLILLTDGLDSTNYSDLIDQMRAAGTTVTIVALGGDANPSLEGLAERGGGAFYRVTRADEVPAIFLSETVRIAGRDIAEGRFLPRAVLDVAPVRGLGTLPPLYGYNPTVARQAARTLIVAPDGDPLLALWQVGLGRSMAWTSDLKGQWASDWLGWAGFGPFVAGLVDALQPPSGTGRLSLESRSSGSEAVFELRVTGEDGRPAQPAMIEGRLLDPTGNGRSLSFSQVGAGYYRAVAQVETAGAYLVQVATLEASGQTVASTSGGLVVSYSPEYAAGRANEALLTDLADLTGGKLNPPAEQLFSPTGQQVGQVSTIALPLLWLALGLLPLDIALRRLMLRPGMPILPRPLRPTPATPVVDPTLARLQAARARIRRPAPNAGAPPAPEANPPAAPPTRSEAQPPAAAQVPQPSSAEETLATLLAARRRRKP